ncbi:caspase recruitment domain-containing protein 8 isoform X2 [Otolemur garnettii]|uniref:caspase recruitment domain-containing protein 8 isoform X2 n=1 Tax=Otolemur garnettii TaxID=30611 RepID=UPI000C7F5B9B|nr:caspase recruitment domain-containing protein 8 isoform X2 [Otolemur garnettii]
MEKEKSSKKCSRCRKWIRRWLCGCGCNIDTGAEHERRCRVITLTPGEERAHSENTHPQYRRKQNLCWPFTSRRMARPLKITRRRSGKVHLYPSISSLAVGSPEARSSLGSPKARWSSSHTISPTFHVTGDEIPRSLPLYILEAEDYPQRQETGDICSEEKPIVSSCAAKLGFEVGQGCKNDQFLEPGGNVEFEFVNESADRYRAYFPTAGSYLWSAVGIGFVVAMEVTVRIAFDSWDQHLDPVQQHHEQWLVAGPLFDITTEPEGAVTEIHLPHFISLQAGEVDVSWFLVAHFKDEGMVLEQPARVEPFYAVLKNPSFSLMGILLRIAQGTHLSVPITCNTLVYYHYHPEDIKFHLYLVPSDPVMRKMIDNEEEHFQGMRLQTSPPVEPLYFGSYYIVSGPAHLEIIPKKLKLSYRSPREIQPFSKFYAGQMKEPIQLEITDERQKSLVWNTVVKPADLQRGTTAASPAFSGAAFVKKHHRHLQARMGDLNGVLDDLQDFEVLTEDEKELVEQEKTRQRKNETLLRMVKNKGDSALELLFKSVYRRDPYLVSYLRQQSLYNDSDR